MASDFYLEAVRERANAIEIELASCKADLLVHQQNGSLSEAGEAVQRIADLTSQQSNLQALTQGYIQSQQPAQPEQLTDEERASGQRRQSPPQRSWRIPPPSVSIADALVRLRPLSR